jgi:hypothetical protein
MWKTVVRWDVYGGDFVGVLLPKSSSVCSFAEIRLLQVSIIVPVLGCCAGL